MRMSICFAPWLDRSHTLNQDNRKRTVFEWLSSSLPMVSHRSERDFSVVLSDLSIIPKADERERDKQTWSRPGDNKPKPGFGDLPKDCIRLVMSPTRIATHMGIPFPLD